MSTVMYRANAALRIIDLIRGKKGCFSKKDLADHVDYSWGLICSLVREMQERGMIDLHREYQMRKGRPREPLSLNEDSQYFCGIDLGASRVRIVFADLGYHVAFQDTIPNPGYSTTEVFFSFLADFFRKSFSASGIAPEKFKGICLAVSGNVDMEKKIIVSAGNMGIAYGTNLFVSLLEEAIGYPVILINSNGAAAVAEYHFGKFAGVPNLVSVSLGVGIGSSAICNARLISGTPERPIGYIGHLLIPGNSRTCSCGFTGCLEAYSGANNLVEIARERFPARKELHSFPALDAAALRGDADAIPILSTAASYNASGVAGMIQLYSPDALVFGGGQSLENGCLFQNTVRELLRIIPPKRRSFQFALTTLGDYQAAMGAMRLAMTNFAFRTEN